MGKNYSLRMEWYNSPVSISIENNSSSERTTQLNSLIGLERTIFQQELSLFNRLQPGEYAGVLTNSPVDVVTILYPQIIEGMTLLYDHTQKESLDLDTVDGFIARYLEKQFFEGILVTDKEVGELKHRIENGDYSQQIEAYRRYRSRFSHSSDYVVKQKDDGSFPDYKRPVKNEGEALYNKQLTLTRFIVLNTYLQAIYGEVDYRKALVTELLLNAPFLHAIVAGDVLNDETHMRHTAYINEIIAFAANFAPVKRREAFELVTDNYPGEWVQEIAAPHLDDLDHSFIKKLYDFTDEFVTQPNLDHVYALLKETLLRRGKVFLGHAVHENNKNPRLILTPRPQTSFTFSDIAGYDINKGYYQKLIEKLQNNDPIVSDIRMIVAAGEPGLGKSLGVQTFLNSLPDNSRAIIASIHYGDHEAKLLAQLAKLHPELQIFIIIEDIDAIAGDRRNFNATRQFLEIDSVTADTYPKNFHILATTNRLENIDFAVMRPGRTTSILVYESPTEPERAAIIKLHADKFAMQLSPEASHALTSKTDNFTPDEIRHLLWLMKYDGITSPGTMDVESYWEQMTKARKLKKGNYGLK